MRSASSMMSVLQLRTSTPVSMIVVQMRMSMLPSSSACQTEDSCSSVILPWAVAMRAPGAILATRAAQFSIVSTRL